MDIGTPIKELGKYDIEPLQQAILDQPEEAWFHNQNRQNDYEVHQYTHSIVLVFTTGEGWPNIEVCLLYTSPSPRDRTRSRMPSSA